MQVGEKLREKAEDSTPGVWLGHVKERKTARRMKQHLSLPSTRDHHTHTVWEGAGRGQEREGRERKQKESTKQALDRYSKAKNVLETTC